eukprot:6210616-Amphidinium_carterae.1
MVRETLNTLRMPLKRKASRVTSKAGGQGQVLQHEEEEEEQRVNQKSKSFSYPMEAKVNTRKTRGFALVSA